MVIFDNVLSYEYILQGLHCIIRTNNNWLNKSNKGMSETKTETSRGKKIKETGGSERREGEGGRRRKRRRRRLRKRKREKSIACRAKN